MLKEVIRKKTFQQDNERLRAFNKHQKYVMIVIMLAAITSIILLAFTEKKEKNTYASIGLNSLILLLSFGLVIYLHVSKNFFLFS